MDCSASQELHSTDGMPWSLDITKIHWANCPAAWKGQFEGKEGIPMIELEVVADYNTWFWHNPFGFPCSLNDLNIWEQSPLLVLESMIDESHNLIDLPFIIKPTRMSLICCGFYVRREMFTLS